MLGEAIGRFKIRERIGGGALGDCWGAAHSEAGHEVVIKLLRPELSALPAMARCFDEVRAGSRLSDAGIAKIYDAGHHPNGRAYLITERVRGETLAARAARGRMSGTQVADLMLQAARALATAQAAGVAHHNLTLTNLMIVADAERPSGDRLVVVDFALGSLIAAMPGLGHAAYMAPEQFGGTADWRVDLYALGCIAFELLSQRPPFVAATAAELRDLHQRAPVPQVKSLVPDAGYALDQLIARMLSKQPGDRPSSLREVAKMFELMVGYNAPVGETVKS
ncbi:MAG: serine/threonine-protein kinase [Kofleriaceae bacterium]